MLNWLHKRPSSNRRAARPASAETMPVTAAYHQTEAPAEVVEPVAELQPVEVEEMPPPFFADSDPAFLDMSEPQTPPPLPKIEKPSESALEARIAEALAMLPPFPAREAPDRGVKLLMILRSLDQIAGDVCTVLENASEVNSPLPVESIPR